MCICTKQHGLFLEGTGAMVLDHLARVAYTAKSNRANAVALERFCTHFNYEPLVFGTTDAAGGAAFVCAVRHTSAGSSPAQQHSNNQNQHQTNHFPKNHRVAFYEGRTGFVEEGFVGVAQVVDEF